MPLLVFVFRLHFNLLQYKLSFMKTLLPVIFTLVSSTALNAQDVRLNDSVIFINNKPVALYAKSLSNSPQRYNMEVYSFNDYILIKAEVIKFNAPVSELRPFYYYELSFPPTGDTLSVYIEEEAFPLVLTKIIRDYNLISGNQINKKNLRRFISNYYGGPALVDKIKSFEDYLNETRYLNEQVVRDRTKPVSIINDRVIMQDGVKIGLITQNQDYKVTNQPTAVLNERSNYGIAYTVIPDQVITNSAVTEIEFANGRKVEPVRYRSFWPGKYQKQEDENTGLTSERNLYQVSKSANKKISAYTDLLLMRICFLIEDYSL